MIKSKINLIEISRELLIHSENNNFYQIEKIARKFTKKELEFFGEHPAFENFGFNARLPKKSCNDIIIADDITFNQTSKNTIKNQNMSKESNIEKQKKDSVTYDEIKKEHSINELIEIYGEDFKLSNLPKDLKIKKEYKAKEFQEWNKQPLEDINYFL